MTITPQQLQNLLAAGKWLVCATSTYPSQAEYLLRKLKALGHVQMMGKGRAAYYQYVYRNSEK